MAYTMDGIMLIFRPPVRMLSGAAGTAPQEFIDMVNSNRDKMISLIRETVQNGGSIFAGTNSVVSKLGLQRSHRNDDQLD